MTDRGWNLVWRWLGGSLLGTLIIAFTSPLFVRSYLPRPLDPVRVVTTMQPGRMFRWRSEGWANTWVGPHGMPGRRDLPPADKDSGRKNTIRIALWGDSQAEGVCVADHDKLHAQIERSALQAIDRDPRLPFQIVLPLGRSGDDAADWLSQISTVESAFAIDVHVLLITEISDLAAAVDGAPDRESGSRIESFGAKILQHVPMFVIHTARMAMTTDGYTPRRLRFSVGPESRLATPSVSDGNSIPDRNAKPIDWNAVTDKIKQTTSREIIVVYAPVVPSITDGRIVIGDSQDNEFQRVKRAAESAGINVLDVRPSFVDSANAGRWPHGFHNGVIGSGHINVVGYQIIARQIASVITAAARQATNGEE